MYGTLLKYFTGSGTTSRARHGGLAEAPFDLTANNEAGADPIRLLRAAIDSANIVRVDLGVTEPDPSALADLIAIVSEPARRACSLRLRVAINRCGSQGAAAIAAAAAAVDLWVPSSLAATPDAGLRTDEVAGFLKTIKMQGKARIRATFEVSRDAINRLKHMSGVAADAGCDEVGFDPIFVADEHHVESSVFFNQVGFNDELDAALKVAKRRGLFADAIKFGTQGRATSDGVPGRLRTLAIRFGSAPGNELGWPPSDCDSRQVLRLGQCNITLAESGLRHMDVEGSHFASGVLRSATYRARTTGQVLRQRFVDQFGAVFGRYDLDVQAYLNTLTALGVALPTSPTQWRQEQDVIAFLNGAIERRFMNTAVSDKHKAVVVLTKPFVGTNWGRARDNLLPDQRQFWRTFNQWQVPTVYVAVAANHDYTVRSIIHNALPGDVIDFLRLSCNGFIPPEQAIGWQRGNCTHVCTIPARVVNEAAGKLCLSFTITRPNDSGMPATVGLRSIMIEASADEVRARSRPLSRLRKLFNLDASVAPGPKERRLGYGRPVPAAEFAEFESYRGQAKEILRGRQFDAVNESAQETVAALAAFLADRVQHGKVDMAADRMLALSREIIERRIDWIKFAPVEHRYLDVGVAYDFFSVLRRMLGVLLSAAEVLGLFKALAEKDPNCRPAALAIADWYIEAGRYDEAIAAARGATHRDVCCLISQGVLRRAYQAKYPNSQDLVIDGVPLYDLSDRFCSIPFDRIETAKDGIVWTCCPAWLTAPIGNMHRMEWEAAWNSDAAGLMRESILDGSFKYCNGGVCPAILAGSLPKKSEVKDPYFRHYIDNHIVKIPDGPREISVSHDPSCNLACPQCRQDFILADEIKKSEFQETIDNFIKPLIEFAEIDRSTILMSGDGEIFVSTHYREVLKLFDPVKHSHARLDLLSNGLVFEAGWKKVPNIHRLVGTVTISTDAASEEVYRVTRGGSWNKLYRNLEYISGLRKEGTIKKFGIHYAVQTCNYKDMRRMVEIGLDLGVDRIAFSILRNSGVYEPAEYAKRCIFEASHPDHAEFVKELADPIFQSPIVDITQFVGFRGDAVVA